MQPPDRSARLNCLDRSGFCSADLVNDIRKRDAHRNFGQSGVLQVACESENLCSLAALGTESRECVGIGDHDGDICESFNVVDGGRITVPAFVGRERGTETGLSALALKGGDHRGFFAADKCPGAFLDHDVKRSAASRQFVVSLFLEFVDCNVQMT